MLPQQCIISLRASLPCYLLKENKPTEHKKLGVTLECPESLAIGTQHHYVLRRLIQLSMSFKIIFLHIQIHSSAMTRTKTSDPWKIDKAFPHVDQAQKWQRLLPLIQVQVSVNA